LRCEWRGTTDGRLHSAFARKSKDAGSENSDHLLSGNSGHLPVALPGQKIVGDSAIYTLAQTLRIRVVTPLVRFEGLPGEFSQHDFGEVRVRYRHGTEEVVHFFASRLKYSPK
jgi:hypothetical protein